MTSWKEDLYEACYSWRSTVAPVIGVGRHDRVIHGSQTPTADTPVPDSADTNCDSVLQMILVYVAELKIDRMLDQLKSWVETGIKKAPTARQFRCPPPVHHQQVSQASISSSALGLYNLIIARVWLVQNAEKLMYPNQHDGNQIIVNKLMLKLET